MDGIVRASVIAVVAVAVLLSGCASKSAKPEGAAGALADAGGAPEDPSLATSGLTGTIFDDEGRPLPGANVTLSPGGRVAASNEEGVYNFGPLAPGPVRVDVFKFGYTAAGIELMLGEGSALRHNFTLTRISSGEARSVVIGPYTGYFQCYWAHIAGSGVCGQARVSGAGVDTGPVVQPIWNRDQNKMTFQLQPGDWERIVLEATWKPSTAATTPKLMLAFSHEGASSTHTFARSDATTPPARIDYYDGRPNTGAQANEGEAKEPDLNHTLKAWMLVPYGNAVDPNDLRFFALAYELRFEIWATVFYGGTGPADYTALQP